ncbi:ATP-binding protein [Phytohabitans sp. ZYX-F-186]|uniref:ATP-binding protein n=1 Tax=Phytohabitans maris TaxID=3071409 RepID=A0ABU0ZBK9_9ACTN|nr:ATP-binding protein [Phytohabitans sp. ZYX-F-186]MDQ7904435.1 ATP-binding protein [Phytohabitans sp. ZYX-F-186]
MTSADPPARDRAGPAPTMGPEAVAVDHQFDADGLYALRAALAAHADHLGATPEQVERLLIVGGELATNAIRHGGGTGRLRLWRDGDLLRCRISDQGPGMPDPAAGSRPPEPTALGGRGLWIVRRLSEDVVVETGPDGTTVTAAIALVGAALTADGRQRPRSG